ncbi:MAG: hypothetical protein V1875_07210 [Candidatus Altiarchaeota archaeon]
MGEKGSRVRLNIVTGIKEEGGKEVFDIKPMEFRREDVPEGIGEKSLLFTTAALSRRYGLDYTSLSTYILNNRDMVSGVCDFVAKARGNVSYRLVTECGKRLTDEHYIVARSMMEDYTPLGGVASKLGVSPSTPHRWLNLLMPEGSDLVCNIFNVDVVRSKPSNRATYYVPKALAADKDLLRSWGRLVRWESVRRRLPEGCRDYTFAAELEEEFGLKPKTIAAYARGRKRKGGKLGDYVSLSEGKIYDGPREAGRLTLFFNPQQTNELRDFYAGESKTRTTHLSVDKLAALIGISDQVLRPHLLHGGGLSEKEATYLGVPLVRYAGNFYWPKNCLSDEEYAALRAEPHIEKTRTVRELRGKLKHYDELMKNRGRMIRESLAPISLICARGVDSEGKPDGSAEGVPEPLAPQICVRDGSGDRLRAYVAVSGLGVEGKPATKKNNTVKDRLGSILLSCGALKQFSMLEPGMQKRIIGKLSFAIDCGASITEDGRLAWDEIAPGRTRWISSFVRDDLQLHIGMIETGVYEIFRANDYDPKLLLERVSLKVSPTVAGGRFRL